MKTPKNCSISDIFAQFGAFSRRGNISVAQTRHMSNADLEDYDLQALILLPSLCPVDIPDDNFCKASWVAIDNTREDSCTGSMPSFQYSEEAMDFPTIFLKEVWTCYKNDFRQLESVVDFDVLLTEKDALPSDTIPLSTSDIFDTNVSDDYANEDYEDKYYGDSVMCAEIGEKEAIFAKENASKEAIQGLHADGISEKMHGEGRNAVNLGKKCRRNFRKKQVRCMEEEFTDKQNEKPSFRRISELSENIRLTVGQVKGWFNNKRKRCVQSLESGYM